MKRILLNDNRLVGCLLKRVLPREHVFYIKIIVGGSGLFNLVVLCTNIYN